MLATQRRESGMVAMASSAECAIGTVASLARRYDAHSIGLPERGRATLAHGEDERQRNSAGRTAAQA